MFRRTLTPSGRGKIASRARLLAAAKILFAAEGYEYTTTAAIARLAGTSESQLMKHFGNKLGLLEDIFDEAWVEITAQVQQAIAQVGSPVEKLRLIGQTVVETIDKDPELKLLMLLEGRRVRKAGGLALTKGFLVFVRLIDTVFHEMRTKELLRPNLHPQAIRSALVGMLEGMLRDRFLAERAGYPSEYNLSELWPIVNVVLASFVVPDKELALRRFLRPRG